MQTLSKPSQLIQPPKTVLSEPCIFVRERCYNLSGVNVFSHSLDIQLGQSWVGNYACF